MLASFPWWGFGLGVVVGVLVVGAVFAWWLYGALNDWHTHDKT